MKTLKPIYRYKRNQRRLLAAWRRGTADIDGAKSRKELAEHFAALKGEPAIYHFL